MVKEIVKPSKDIVASFAPELKAELKKLVLEKGVDELEIDMSSVEMIDSVGLGIFIATHNSLQQKGGKLIVSNLSQDIYSLFKTMRLDQHFTVTSV